MATARRGDGAVLGIDLGTSEVKAALVTPDGRLLGLGRGTYSTDTGPDGRAEQDPLAWHAAIGAAVRAALVAVEGGAPEVAAICCVGQGPTLVAVDADGAPMRPAVTWQDRRAGAGGYGLLPRMAWLAREDPETVARTRWLLAAWDAVGCWLTGEAVATAQGHETPIAPEAAAAAGVDPALVPPPLPFGSMLGRLRAGVAETLGLPAGTPVVAGVNDGTASMLGAGLRAAGDAVDVGGTSGGIGIYAAGSVDLPGVFVAPAPLPGLWVVGGAMAALGATVDWVRATLLAEAQAPDDVFRAALRVPPGADGLVMLPYLAGERAPVFDETARGVLYGLTLAHGPDHVARAALEAAAFALRSVVEPIAAAGTAVTELRLAGRPSPDDTWARIKADVLGVPVAIPVVGETAVMGAAVLAARGAGLFGSLAEAVASMPAVARRLEPDPSTSAAYDAAFGTYQALYPALAPVFRRTAS